MSNQINIILGLKNTKSAIQLPGFFKETIPKYLDGNHELGEVAYTCNKDELEQAIGSGNYQACFVMEEVDGTPFGQGAVKRWRKECKDMHIILLMGGNRKGTAKVKGLFDINYYDGIFIEDFNNHKLMALLLQYGRTEGEAYSYYGLENYVEPVKEKKKKKSDEAISEDATGSVDTKEKVSTDDSSPAPAAIDPSQQKEQSEDNKKEDIENSSMAQNKEDTSSDNESFSSDTDKEDVTEDNNIKEAESTEPSNEQEPLTETEEALESETAEEADEEPTDASNNVEESIVDYEDAGSAEEYDTYSEEDEPVNDGYIVVSTSEDENKEDITLNLKTKEELLKGGDKDKVAQVLDKEPEFTSSTSNVNVKTDKKKSLSLVLSGGRTPNKNLSDVLRSTSSAQAYFDTVTKGAYKEQKDSDRENFDKAEQIVVATLETFLEMYEVALDDVAMGIANANETVENYIYDIIESAQSSAETKEEAHARFLRFVYGYDFLEDILSDEEVTDIHVLDSEHIRVKKNGERYTANYKFFGLNRYERLCRQLLLRNRENLTSSGLTSTFTDQEYSEDFYLQVTIIDKKINSTHEPELIIKKTISKKRTLASLVDKEYITVKQAAYLAHEVNADKGILIIGSGSSGKTTVLNAMIDYIPKNKCGTIIQYRDELLAGNHPEMVIQHPLVERVDESGVRHEGVTFVDLAENAIQKENDYIILGDIKGKEADSFYKALIAGYCCWGCVTAQDVSEGINKFVSYIANLNMDARAEIKQNLGYKLGTIVLMDHLHIKDVYRVCGYEDGKVLYESIIDNE